MPRAELGDFGLDLTAKKPGVKPGDDFYGLVNGGWLESYQLKPDETRFGSFLALAYRAEDQVKAIVEQLAKGAKPGSIEQQVGDYYESFMDVQALTDKGIEPLRTKVDAIDSIDGLAALVNAFGRAPLDESNAPLVIMPSIDRKKPERYVLNVASAGLGLPDRSFYLEPQFAEMRAAYQAHVAQMLGFAGLSGSDGEAAAKRVVALETSIAKQHWPRAELRNPDKTNNQVTLAALEAKAPKYPWRRHLTAAGIDPASVDDINLYTPNAIAPLVELVRATPLSTWKPYLTYHLIANHAGLLGETIDLAHFEFAGKVLHGQEERRDRWKRAIALIGGMSGLGEAIGKIYIEHHYPAKAEAQMQDLITNMRASLRKRLQTLAWMGDETRKQALAKLDAFNPKIGHPDKWRDFSSILIVPDDLMANYHAVAKYWYEDEIARLSKPTDKAAWEMTPQTVNAYYNPPLNEIVFPAAILQPPFFDPAADPAVNYGGIGAVIGHEMGHGFDDQGSKYDARGVQKNWWTADDRQHFEERTAALVEQYNQYEPLPGTRLNGQLTLGENIGDLGGLAVAYDAYHASLNGKPAPVIDGMTGDQRFFWSWAQVWRMKVRDKTALQLAQIDPHSPGKFRVNGVVRNLDVWYDAFGVGPDAALYLPPDKRVSIW
jgi:putative endopeptidase